jgi:hypothetical protein
MLVTCPSGLSFQARPWKIGDRKHLHDQQTLRQGLLMRKMLEAVDQGIEDPGPYAFEVGSKVQWAEVALVDVIDALVDIRISTKAQLDYNENCESCGAIIPLSVDLRELERTPMSNEAKQHLATEEPILKQVSTDNGDIGVNLRMLRGKDSARISQFYKQEPSGMQEIQMCLHIVELKGADSEALTDFRKIRAFYQDQSWDFHTGIDEAISEFSGGVDTLVKSFCKSCNAEQEGILPFGAEFFYPRKRRSISSMATL